jgi:hypothetical protein
VCEDTERNRDGSVAAETQTAKTAKSQERILPESLQRENGLLIP